MDKNKCPFFILDEKLYKKNAFFCFKALCFKYQKNNFSLTAKFFLYFIKKDLGVFFVRIYILKILMKKRQKSIQYFECIECNFKCSKNSEFERHKMTAKHQRLTNPNKKTPNLYSCVCGKDYKHQSTLCAHKKIVKNGVFS